MVDQLAQEYAGQPVVFIEDAVSSPKGDRYSRFWAAHGSGSAYFPLVMVDSGSQCLDGPTSYHDTYKAMVDAELARAPQAEVSAVQQRVGSRLVFDVTVKNLSGVSLSSGANSARVHVLVYEDIHAGVTNRYMRAAPNVSISTPLAHNAAATYHLETADLSGVDWSKLHAVALVDYRPGGSGKYDMLQAAFAVESSFSVSPSSLRFMVDESNPVDQQKQLTPSGAPASLTWTVTENIPWLTVTPTTGAVGQTAAVEVNAAALASGLQSGSIHVEAAGSGYSYQLDIPVSAYKGPLEAQYFPITLR